MLSSREQKERVNGGVCVCVVVVVVGVGGHAGNA